MKNIKGYLGFALKSKNILFGIDQIIENKKPAFVILYSNLSENSFTKLKKFATYNNIYSKQVEEEVLPLGCKAIAITEKNLAQAIKEKLEVEDC